MQKQLQEIQDIYLEKYPQYLEKIANLPNMYNIDKFSEKLLESHKKCLKIANEESSIKLQDISINKPKSKE